MSLYSNFQDLISVVSQALLRKQDNLTAGDGITIENGVIKLTGGSLPTNANIGDTIVYDGEKWIAQSN